MRAGLVDHAGVRPGPAVRDRVLRAGGADSAGLRVGRLRACWQTLLAAPPAPRRRPAALSSSPIQQRYRLLLRLAGPPPGSPGASTEDLPTGSEGTAPIVGGVLGKEVVGNVARPARQQTRSVSTRQAFLDAARAVFGEQG